MDEFKSWPVVARAQRRLSFFWQESSVSELKPLFTVISCQFHGCCFHFILNVCLVFFIILKRFYLIPASFCSLLLFTIIFIITVWIIVALNITLFPSRSFKTIYKNNWTEDYIWLSYKIIEQRLFDKWAESRVLICYNLETLMPHISCRARWWKAGKPATGPIDTFTELIHQERFQLQSMWNFAIVSANTEKKQ